MVASVIISLMMTNLYKSTVIIFPAKTSTVSFSEQRNAKNSSMDFGEDEEAEQMIQILQSSRIRNNVIGKFDLMNHYKIDTSHEFKYTLLTKEYESKVSFERTQYGSIEISVLDRSKDTAALMANYIADLLDQVKNDMVKERTVKAFEITKRKYETLQAELDQLIDTIQALNAMGVVGDQERASLYQSLGTAKTAKEREYILELIEVNNKYGSTVDAFSELREFKLEKFTRLEAAYEQAESDANADFTHKFTVERATPADRKSYPVRSLIVIVSFFASILFAVFLIMSIEKIRELRSKA